MAAKKLLDVGKEEQLAFLNSFDTVFCDVDGVLWHPGNSHIDGAIEAIKNFRNLGKKIYFMTNNSTVDIDQYIERMKAFETVKEEVIRPSKVIAWYLKQINFDKEVYVVGFHTLKNELRDAGFKVVFDEVGPMGETIPDMLKNVKNLNPNVGAVLVDFAVNIDYMGIQKCVEYITQKNAIFLIGAADPVLPFFHTALIGIPYFVKAIEDITGKSPIVLSKPGKEFHKVVMNKIGPLDPKRVLFIGDSPLTDMQFATDHNYQKLLPLTGCTKKEDLENWKYDEKTKPDYVVDSVKDLVTIFDCLELNKHKL